MKTGDEIRAEVKRVLVGLLELAKQVVREAKVPKSHYWDFVQVTYSHLLRIRAQFSATQPLDELVGEVKKWLGKFG